MPEKKIDYSFSKYLIDLDLINKYNIRSVYKKPKISKLIIKMPMAKVLNGINGSNTNELYLKSFIYFYFFTNVFPKIVIVKNKVNKNDNFYLVHKTNNHADISLCLDELFTESKILLNKALLITRLKTASVTFRLSTAQLQDLDNLTNNEHLSLKEFSFLFTVFFKNCPKFFNIQNVPRFWISG